MTRYVLIFAWWATVLFLCLVSFSLCVVNREAGWALFFFVGGLSASFLMWDTATTARRYRLIVKRNKEAQTCATNRATPI